jgi:hypothetical protein
MKDEIKKQDQQAKAAYIAGRDAIVKQLPRIGEKIFNNTLILLINTLLLSYPF